MNEAGGRESDNGRDFASVVNLLQGQEVICRVAVAFSIVKTGKDPLKRLVKSAFATNGPIYQRLGLAKGSVGGCKTP